MSWRDYMAIAVMVVLVMGAMIAIRRLVTKGDRDDDRD